MSGFREARDEITGESWADDLARASLSAADAKYPAMRKAPRRPGRRKIGRVGSLRIFVEGDAVILGIGGLSAVLGASQREKFALLYREAEHEAETAAEMGGP